MLHVTPSTIDQCLSSNEPSLFLTGGIYRGFKIRRPMSIYWGPGAIVREPGGVGVFVSADDVILHGPVVEHCKTGIYGEPAVGLRTLSHRLRVFKPRISLSENHGICLGGDGAFVTDAIVTACGTHGHFDHGIYISGTGAILRRCIVRGCVGCGIHVYADPKPKAVEMVDCVFSRNGWNWIGATEATMFCCTFAGNLIDLDASQCELGKADRVLVGGTQWGFRRVSWGGIKVTRSQTWQSSHFRNPTDDLPLAIGCGARIMALPDHHPWDRPGDLFMPVWQRD